MHAGQEPPLLLHAPCDRRQHSSQFPMRYMSGLDIRDVRVIQVIHGGISNWLLRPFAHGRFVTWEGFRTRTEAVLWSTCSKLLCRSAPQPAYLGKGSCWFYGTEHRRFQQEDQGSRAPGQSHPGILKISFASAGTSVASGTVLGDPTLIATLFGQHQQRRCDVGYTATGESLTVFYSLEFFANGECGRIGWQSVFLKQVGKSPIPPQWQQNFGCHGRPASASINDSQKERHQHLLPWLLCGVSSQPTSPS